MNFVRAQMNSAKEFTKVKLNVKIHREHQCVMLVALRSIPLESKHFIRFDSILVLNVAECGMCVLVHAQMYKNKNKIEFYVEENVIFIFGVKPFNLFHSLCLSTSLWFLSHFLRSSVRWIIAVKHIERRWSGINESVEQSQQQHRTTLWPNRPTTVGYVLPGARRSIRPQTSFTSPHTWDAGKAIHCHLNALNQSH